jgi:hypothetical protein
MTRQADFDCGLIGDCLWLEDLDAGGMSLTNAIEPSLYLAAMELNLTVDSLVGRLIVYRDSDGVWDAVRVNRVVDGLVKSVDFLPLRVKTLHEATALAQTRYAVG